MRPLLFFVLCLTLALAFAFGVWEWWLILFVLLLGAALLRPERPRRPEQSLRASAFYAEAGLPYGMGAERQTCHHCESCYTTINGHPKHICKQP